MIRQASPPSVYISHYDTDVQDQGDPTAACAANMAPKQLKQVTGFRTDDLQNKHLSKEVV